MMRRHAVKGVATRLVALNDGPLLHDFIHPYFEIVFIQLAGDPMQGLNGRLTLAGIQIHICKIQRRPSFESVTLLHWLASSGSGVFAIEVHVPSLQVIFNFDN